MDKEHDFASRVIGQWLPTYCEARGYGIAGFKAASIVVDEADARDCLLAIDTGVVVDQGGGRYRAARSAAIEVLFWEGAKTQIPRPITLWLEPVICFAALARLHTRFRWPKESLCSQPPGYAFDVAAYDPVSERPVILCEVKKTHSELERLRCDLETLSRGSGAAVLENSARKWQALMQLQPNVLWLLGPGEKQHVFTIDYSLGDAKLRVAGEDALNFESWMASI
jgi:hypothetical protein